MTTYVILFLAIALVSQGVALRRQSRLTAWKREFLGRWIELVQVGETEQIVGIPVYRTLGFCRVRWVVDPFGRRVECDRLCDAVDEVLRRSAA